LAKQWAIARLRHVLEPWLPEGIPWADLPHVLEEVETLKELRNGIESADLFAWKLFNSKDWPAAKSFACVKLRLLLQSKLPIGVRWDDFFPILKLLDDDQIQELLDNFERFIQKLRLDPTSEAFKRWTVAQLRPKLEEELARQGNEWAEVASALLELDVESDLMVAIENPTGLLMRLAAGPSAVLYTKGKGPC